MTNYRRNNMFYCELDLELDYERAGLNAPDLKPRFSGYIPKNYEYCKGRLRPAVLILPGGGYASTSEREATPVAVEFLSCGAAVFVLHYSVKPNAYYPTSLCQVYSAIKMIRKNADEWNIDPDNISVMGFSAGGHLAASAGVLWSSDAARKIGFEGDSHKPNGMILCYPVISAFAGSTPHTASFDNLLGENNTEENFRYLSLEKRVTADTPRAFIWHIYEDSVVPVENSMIFASALIANKVPIELHIYPHGGHGRSIANDLVCNDMDGIAKVNSWVELAKEWITKD